MEKHKIYISSSIRQENFHHEGDEVELKSLYLKGTIVLKVFARFGCPCTRYDAYLLDREKEQLKAVGASLVGIGFDQEGIEEFSENKLWNGELFLDTDREVYRSLCLARCSKIQAIRNLLHKKTRKLSI